MLAERERRRFTAEEYLLIEEQSELKSEYHDGEIFSMTGGSYNHALIVGNLLAFLLMKLRGGKCRAIGSDLRLYVERAHLFTYPDVMVICGAPVWYARRRDTVTDARLIFEVLSPSTERYDREDKFRMYQALPSLQEYVLVSQDEVSIERHHRDEAGRWSQDTAPIEDGHLALLSLDVRIPVSEIYLDVLPGLGVDQALE